MSSEIDPRYLQIIFCYYDVAQKVVRKYTELQIQKYSSDWRDFLNKNIHDIYHLWIHDTRCCQCPEAHSEVLYQRDRVLRREQIELMFKIDGPETTGHCIRDKRRKQYCLCKVSVKTSSTLESIDVPLLVSVFKNCVQTKSDYDECRTIFENLREVRNKIAHATNTKMKDENSEELWGKLTNAILTLAENIPIQPEFYAEIEREINECQEKSGSLEQIQITMQFLRSHQQQQQQDIIDVQDLVKSLKRSMSEYDRNDMDCSGIQMEGYLDLKKLSVITLKRYKPFWFVLQAQGKLEHYEEKSKREGEVQPLKTLNILKYTEIKLVGKTEFKVAIGNKKLTLKANSKESREKWMTAIQAIQNRQFSKKMFGSFHLPDEVAESDIACDNSAGQSIDKIKELASSSSSLSPQARKSERMSELLEVPKKPMQVVAAIDFGTTFSGAAFSTKSSFESNPLRVENIQLDKKKAYHKTQTSVLFRKLEFIAFGEQAERRYQTLSLKEETDDLFFFRNFKMQLHGEKLSKSLKLHTIDGKEKSCITVIAACIEHIKEKAIERIKQMNKSIDDFDIHWVLTVPAIWSEQARQFMIKAAEKTGIDRDNLSLALEPECAAVYCKHDELVKDTGQRNSALQSFRPGSKFMVVDLGGGTVDITVSEVLESGKIKEISKASGGKWGGDNINKKIVDLLDEIFGPEMKRLRSEELNSYLELLADIESAKRNYDDEDDFTIKLPESLQKLLNVGELARKFGNNIVIGKGKKHLLFSQEKMKDIFSKCISDITKHIVGLLEEAIGVTEIILVGGYASSPLVQTAFEKEFGQNFKLIIPQNPEIVVLTGAVISGHSKEPITGRVAKYNYGLGIRASVAPGDENLLLANDKHRKMFRLLIEKGRRMDVGKYVESCKIKVADSNQLDAIELYITKSDNPEHEININDFTKIGTIKFKLPKLRKPTTFAVSLWYDETEFRVMAEDENSDLHFEGIIQYFE